jgi:hypothetical protein
LGVLVWKETLWQPWFTAHLSHCKLSLLFWWVFKRYEFKTDKFVGHWYQRDQISFWKYCPTCSPAQFFCQN